MTHLFSDISCLVRSFSWPELINRLPSPHCAVSLGPRKGIKPIIDTTQFCWLLHVWFRHEDPEYEESFVIMLI